MLPKLPSKAFTNLGAPHFDLGYGSALSWLTLIIVLVVVLLFVRLTGFMKLVADKENR
ncbi:hypothetical protein [Microbulbifer sp. S227A]|uniref:hypothetical protein n=1 Tax=Microbulbifer sp. S227A TaxID=3415131 RepID=UPI003C7DE221